MANKRTESSKYPSRYSPGNFVTEAQYITELICEKKAAAQKKELPSYFWKLPEWAKFYRQQILAANALLRIYKGRAIIKALNSKEAWNVQSLRAPHLDAIIEAEQRNLKEVAVEEKVVEVDTTEKPRPTMPNKNSLKNRLRDL